MLKSLQVLNFALIEHVTLTFRSGLTVLTGETGAGKSILIDALNVVLGERASTDFIRNGCDFFRVEAVFDITTSHAVINMLEEHDITQEDDKLIISRRLSKSSKNTIVINGCQAPLAVLKKLGELLIDMHGQHENQALLRPESHLTLLDAYDPQIGELLNPYRECYLEWHRIKNNLARLAQSSRDQAQRIDMLTWQTQEIAAASLKVGEEDKLESEVRVLANAERIAKSVERSYILFHQGGKGSHGVLSALVEIRKELETISRYDNSLDNALQIVQDAWHQLNEAASEISSYSDIVEYNPKRLAKLQDRLDILYKLKKKYGATIEEVLDYYQQSLNELDTIGNSEGKATELEKEKTDLEEKLMHYSHQLDVLRRDAANKLSATICIHLADLAIPEAKLVFDIIKTPNFGPHGINQVNLLFSANPGQELKSLHKIASGGELSRVALAIKTVSSGRDAVGTMVFDEVDAGIGGQTAQMVAEKVALVATTKQVLAITHLSQMACMAEGHYHIAKHTEDGRTYTTVHELNTEERVREITRMMVGETLSPLALENTAQLLAVAKQKRDKWKNKAQA